VCARARGREAIVISSRSEVRVEEASSEYLTFFVQGEEYALGLTRVREVIPFDTITRVPQLPPAIVGVTNLRGAVVPVLDLAMKLFGLSTVVDKRTCIVLVEVGEEVGATTIGIMTEAVGQVLALTASDISPPPSFGAPIRTEFLHGMGKVGKKFALLLDVERLLTHDELRSPELASAPLEAEGDVAAAEGE
jgi:purine-binding chemotaxis protein CheW